MAEFTIRGENYHWLNETGEKPDNAADLCLHGSVTVTIGDTTLTGVGTVSAAALYLLKSITEDHIPGTDNQMVPCCGHFFCPDEAEENVTIIGCHTGLDWTITHDGDRVLLTLPDCAPVPVAKREYIAEVLRFTDTVERYYIYSSDKKLPEDPFTRKGYKVFWREWHRRYREAAEEAMRDPEARKYTIIETHTNTKENDISDVHLHDCEVTAVLRDGEDLVFYIPEGITVWRETECNPTSRHLQTGAAEIRLVKAAKPETADCGRYTIISHRYHTVNKVLTLKMLPGGPGSRVEEQRYRFACERVEYRFDGYTGDADLQRYDDDMGKKFINSLCAGNGSAYIQLRNWTTARGKRAYAPILAEIMCQENDFDWQNRAGYFLDLYDLFAPPEQEKILRYVLDRPLETRFEVLQTYAPVLKAFADRGVNEAQTALDALYRYHRSAYDNRTEQPSGYDELGSIVMYLCGVLGKELPETLQRTGERPQEPELTIETIIENAVHWQPVRTFHPARYRNFLQNQPPEEIAKLAEAAMAETDPETKVRLCSLFDAVDFPGDPTVMIGLLRERLEVLTKDLDSSADMTEKQRQLGADRLVRALARLRHPSIRELGWEMAEKSVGNEKLRRYALELVCSNYDENRDWERMADFLEVVPPWENDRNTQHDEDYIVLTRMFTRRYENPQTYGFLKTIYYYTYCPDCRYEAVKILAEHGMLPEHIREQCLWDCNTATRQLAREMEGKTK